MERRSTLTGNTIPVTEVKGGFSVRHEHLEKEVKTAGLTVSYRAVFTSGEHNIVECTMTFPDGHTVTKVGETTPETLYTKRMRQYPGTTAYQRAYDRAAIAALGLGGRIFSILELNPALTKGNRQTGQKEETATPKASVTRPVFPDEEVLLFGRFKGMKFKDAKKREGFDDFAINFLKREGVVYNNPDLDDQAARLRMALKGV